MRSPRRCGRRRQRCSAWAPPGALATAGGSGSAPVIDFGREFSASSPRNQTDPARAVARRPNEEEAMAKKSTRKPAKRARRLRSRAWFDNPANPSMTAIYLERYLNFGLTREELGGGKPIIGIAQTGSDLSPCNRHHLELAKRVREGIRSAGGIAFEFPTHPIQETGKRPTAALDRNLAYLGLVEVLYGYPLDGVVLLTGCDKTTPACLMAAATVNLPAIVLSGGPMLEGWGEGGGGGSRAGGGGGKEGEGGGPHRLQGIPRHRRLLGALDRALQHH